MHWKTKIVLKYAENRIMLYKTVVVYILIIFLLNDGLYYNMYIYVRL